MGTSRGFGVTILSSNKDLLIVIRNKQLHDAQKSPCTDLHIFLFIVLSLFVYHLTIYIYFLLFLIFPCPIYSSTRLLENEFEGGSCLV